MLKVDHELKCWPEYFCQLERKIKTIEIRKGTDRIFLPGQIILFREWDPRTKGYSGSSQYRRINYVIRGGHWLPDDVWALGLEVPKELGE